MKLLLSFSALLLLEAVNAAPESLPVEDDTSKALSGDRQRWQKWLIHHNLSSPTLHKNLSNNSQEDSEESDMEWGLRYTDMDDEYGEPDIKDILGEIDSDYILIEADSERDISCSKHILKLMEENYRLRNDLLFIRSFLGMLPLSGNSSNTFWNETDSDWADTKIDESDSDGADTKIDESDSAGTKTTIDNSDNQKDDTYEVHMVNGTRVEVNTTTTRNESADGTETVYHTKVIDIQPEGDMQNNTIIQITEIIKSGSSTIEEIPTLGTKEEDKSTLSTKSEDVQQNEESSSSVTTTDNGFKIHLN